ncbi:MAG: GNAT family N-acetyltransferase [Vicinamibacterales bacterium]
MPRCELPSLLARAYAAPDITRPFARHQRSDEWCEYAAQLLGSSACGRFDPERSTAWLSPEGRLDGAVVTTIVGPGTAHLAQVAVDPARRGAGMATTLVTSAMERVRAERFERVSLLVSEHNAAARRLYERLGFRATSSFIAAGRPAPATIAANRSRRHEAAR